MGPKRGIDVRHVGPDLFRVTFASGREIEISETELRSLLGQRFRDAVRREAAAARVASR